MQVRNFWLTGAVAAVALLGACAERELILEGERLSVDAVLGLEGDNAQASGPRAQAISLPAMVSNSDWAQRGGNAQHLAPHAALSAQPKLLWAQSIGSASSRKNRINAAPVVAGGRIFTLDAASTVAATATSGAPLWQVDLTAGFDGGRGLTAGGISGGGLASNGTQVFATTGFGEVVALEAASGRILWRQRLDAPAIAAPSVSGNAVYVTARNGTAWAINAQDGKVLWQVEGTIGPSGYLGAAAPTVGPRSVFFPSSSGDLTAVLKEGGGSKMWQVPLSGARKGRAYAQNFDVTGDAVLSGNILYAGTASGRISALEAGSGDLIWTLDEGAMGPAALAGGNLFVISDEAHLVRIDAQSGKRVWSVALPYFINETPKKRQAVTAHYGPVLAGGRLWVAGSDGVLRGFSAQSGELTYSVAIPGGAAAQPAVAGGTFYIVSNSGQLLAFR